MQKEGKVLVFAVVLLGIIFFYGHAFDEGSITGFVVVNQPATINDQYQGMLKEVFFTRWKDGTNNVNDPDGFNLEQAVTWSTTSGAWRKDPNAPDETITRTESCDGNTVEEGIRMQDVKIQVGNKVFDHLKRNYFLVFRYDCSLEGKTCNDGTCHSPTFDPEVIGTYPSLGFSFETPVFDLPYVFGYSQSEGLLVVDVTDAMKPQVLTTAFGRDYGYNAKDYSNGNLYVASDPRYTSQSQFAVLQFTPPNTFQVLGTLALSNGGAEALTVLGRYAYLLGSGRFRVVDIQDPSNPVLVYDASSARRQIITVDRGRSILYAYDPSARTIGLYRITDATPRFLSSITVTSTGAIATMTGGLYTNNGNYYFAYPDGVNLHIVNVNDPANPQQLPVIPFSRIIISVGNKNNYFYVRVSAVDENSVEPVHIIDAITGREVGTFSNSVFSDHVSLSNGNELFFYGNHFFGGADLWLYDISNPINPVLQGAAYGDGSTGSIVKTGNYILKKISAGLLYIDVRDSKHPSFVQLVDTGLRGLGGSPLLLYKNLLFIGNTYENSVWDISQDVLHPTFVQDLRQTALDKLIVARHSDGRDYLYAAAGFDGVLLYRFSSSGSSVSYVGSYIDTTGPGAQDIAVLNDIAYVAYHDLTVLDVSNPSNPQLIRNIDLPNNGYTRVIVDPPYLYALRAIRGVLDIYSLTDPRNPVLVKTFTLFPNSDSIVKEFAYKENHLFISFAPLWGSGVLDILGLYVVDISDRMNPFIVKHFDGKTYGGAGSIILDENNLLYLDDGFKILDIFQLYT